MPQTTPTSDSRPLFQVDDDVAARPSGWLGFADEEKPVWRPVKKVAEADSSTSRNKAIQCNGAPESNPIYQKFTSGRPAPIKIEGARSVKL